MHLKLAMCFVDGQGQGHRFLWWRQGLSTFGWEPRAGMPQLVSDPSSAASPCNLTALSPQLPHLRNGYNNNYLRGGVGGPVTWCKCVPKAVPDLRREPINLSHRVNQQRCAPWEARTGLTSLPECGRRSVNRQLTGTELKGMRRGSLDGRP